MRFDTSQQMKLGQQMKLAPRMIQSMEILQMALPELEERIELELESNVALERVEGSVEEGGEAGVVGGEPESEPEISVDSAGGADEFERLDAFELDHPEVRAEDDGPSERSRSSASEYEPGSYSAARMSGERDGKMDAMANAAARAGSLTDQLLGQWAFAEVDEALREPGRRIIELIDDDGYLRTPVGEIASGDGSAVGGGGGSVEVYERALRAVQLFLDPPGIGARDTRECLLLQLDALGESSSHAAWELTRSLVSEHLDDLAHNRLPRIAQKLGVGVGEVNSALESMRRLSLRPGRQLVADTPPTIVPDAMVEYDEDSDEYIAYLTDARMANLRLNREYAEMARDRAVPKGDRDFLKTNLANAQWLIDAVQQRRQTLLRVLRVVVAAQRDVFELGEQAMRPLPMTQVAEQLGIHVATVSRAVAGKHVQTPRGVMPLRKFFTGGTQTDSGEDVSWDAIKAALRDVIEAEDKSKPLSDDALVKALRSKGIEIARRTVAKYRSQLDIPPARLRRRY